MPAMDQLPRRPFEIPLARAMRALCLALALAAPAACGTESASTGDIERVPGEDTYRVRLVGEAGESAQAVERRALTRAARFALALGHSHVAVLARSVEAVTGSSGLAGTIATRVPIVRSRRPGRGRRGAVTSIELGRPLVPSVVVRFRPFSGDPPAGAEAVYQAEELL